MNAIARRSALAPCAPLVSTAGGNAQGEARSFTLPPGYDLVEIRGDIMTPTYQPGTLAIVDRSTLRVTGEGLYFVHDGVGEACRRISACNTPGRWAVYQDNKAYSTYQETPDRIDVTGRVVGVFQRV